MKKIYKSIMILIIALSIILLPSIANAESEDTDNNITLEGVYVTSKDGKYKTGDSLTFEVRFSTEIKLPTNLALKIKIGENSKNMYPIKGEEQGKILKYSCTINGEAGKVTFESFNFGDEINTKDLEGNNIKIANNIKDFKNSVSIDVNEPVWTDASKCEYTINENYAIQISGISKIEKHDYHIFFSVGNDEVKIEKDKNGKITNSYSTSFEHNIEDLLERSEDIYMSIVEEQLDYSKAEVEYISKTILEKKKIEKPAQKNLTQRIYGTIWFLDGTSENIIFVQEPHTKERKLNVYAGKVTDKSILSSIKNKEPDGMSKLLNYAKKNSSESNKYVFTEQDNMGFFNPEKIIKEESFNANEYYYMYYVLDDENGKYTKVEDIELFYANNNKAGYYLVSNKDSRFKWTDVEPSETNNDTEKDPTTATGKIPQTDVEPSETNNDTEKDPTTATGKIPQTGEKIIAIVSLMIVTIVLLVISYCKINKYRGI